MKKIIECVPNISEGRNKDLINQIVDAARLVDGVDVLDVDAGAATNRTVITFVGGPEAVTEAAFRLIKRAGELIDMSNHKGEHSRIGATDVVPFVPVQNVTMEECIACAKKLGERVAKELNIPVYLYEAAATKPERKSLATIREGEYEGLSKKIVDSNWKPDYGKAEFNKKSGATVIGARPFLIAYNINLNTKSKKLATHISQRLRESGYKKKDENGNFIQDDKGSPVVVKGAFVHCRAVGWFIEEYESAQISINLTDFEVTSIHAVFDEACRLATEVGLRVTGSEIVGLVPKKAMLETGRHYLRKQGASTAVPEKEIFLSAMRTLGLNEFSPFKIAEKVIEEKIKTKPRLVGMTLPQFNDLLSSSAPAPGGGSVAALCGSLSAALVSMVAALSFDKGKEANKKIAFENVGLEAQSIKDSLMQAVDDDTAAFDLVMAAFKIKADSPENEKRRKIALIEAYKAATLVPHNVAKQCLRVMELSKEVLNTGLASAFSDSAVALELAHTALLGASYNVLINLKELDLLLDDKQFVDETRNSLSSWRQQASKLLIEANATIDKTLSL